MASLIQRTRKLPGDIELIGNGHRREVHRYGGDSIGRQCAERSHADRIRRFLINREKARG